MIGERVALFSSGTLVGTDVVNSQGEHLGELEELMFDVDTGNIAYAVLSFGGLFGIGDKFFAIPWQALTVDQQSEQIVFNVKKETLESAPGFDKDNWPSSADYDFLTQVYNHYGFSYSR